jgi:hypothetical protein
MKYREKWAVEGSGAFNRRFDALSYEFVHARNGRTSVPRPIPLGVA